MSLKNLSAKIKIPKLLKEKLSNKKIDQIYKRFEEFDYLLIYLIKTYESSLIHSNFLDSYFAFWITD